jgi:hypothetical protein
MQHSQLLFNLENQTMDFSYTIFPVKKINVGKILKLWEHRYLNILAIHILKLEISGCDNIEQRIDTCIKTHAKASPEYNMN